MAKVDGAVILLKINDTLLTGLTDNSFAYSVSEIQTTTKDSNGHDESIPGEDNGSLSFNCLYDKAGTYNLADMLGFAKAKTIFQVVMVEDIAGGLVVTANGYLTKVDWTAPKNTASGFSGTIKLTGEITFSTNSDVTAPLLAAAFINNATPTVLRLQFSEDLDPNYKPASSVWTIGGVSKTISSYAISGKNITITVTVAFASGDAPTIAYTNPGSGGIRDKSGNVLATFTAEAVTNNVA